MAEVRDELELSFGGMAAQLELMLGEPVTAAQVRAYENPRCIPPGDVLVAAMLLERAIHHEAGGPGLSAS